MRKIGLTAYPEIIDFGAVLIIPYNITQWHSSRIIICQGCRPDPHWLLWRTKDGREVDFIIEKGGQFIAIEAKLTGAPTLDAAKGFNYFKSYYGKDAVLKEYVICRVKKDHAIGKGVKAINGVQLEL